MLELVRVNSKCYGFCTPRLIPALGAEGAAHLHAYLIDRTLSMVTAINNVNVTLWFMPSPDDPEMPPFFGQAGRS
jgi:glycosyltransferase A (GT-A) superfamily protein (DUF2064 family)